ncbi:MAG: protein-disulfide reductase DsbD domain-containing protein [Luteolibacter sp.]
MTRIACTTTALVVACAGAAAEPVRSGRAQVEWIAKTAGYSPGEPVVTALKMTLDQGWHTYWINPGEAGMPLSVDFKLPDGWSADDPAYPFPIRFKTGDLSDFGYEGSVIFPIVIHPPAGVDGDIAINASFSWLVCDDSACIPGDAMLSLTLKAGDSTPTPAAAEITKTINQIPTDAPEGWQLSLTETPKTVKLELTIPDGHHARELVVFPRTIDAIHPAAEFEWKASGDKWATSVPKSPFAPETIEAIDLVISAPSLDRPITVGWSAKE